MQVLQELHVNLSRRGRSVVEATQIVRDFYHWPVVENTLPLLDDAFDTQARWQLSLWDALIVAAARASGARELLTEDLKDFRSRSRCDLLSFQQRPFPFDAPAIA